MSLSTFETSVMRQTEGHLIGWGPLMSAVMLKVSLDKSSDSKLMAEGSSSSGRTITQMTVGDKVAAGKKNEAKSASLDQRTKCIALIIATIAVITFVSWIFSPTTIIFVAVVLAFSSPGFIVAFKKLINTIKENKATKEEQKAILKTVASAFAGAVREAYHKVKATGSAIVIAVAGDSTTSKDSAAKTEELVKFFNENQAKIWAELQSRPVRPWKKLKDLSLARARSNIARPILNETRGKRGLPLLPLPLSTPPSYTKEQETAWTERLRRPMLTR